jgi:hypothetical protein
MDPVVLVLVGLNLLTLAACGYALHVAHVARDGDAARAYDERDAVRREVLTLTEHFAEERAELLKGFSAERRALLDRALLSWEIVIARSNDPEVEAVVPAGIASDEIQHVPIGDDAAHWDEHEGQTA